MIKYPTIINSDTTDKSSVLLSLFISKEIAYFQGHFPTLPILPGIAQVDWVFFFAKKFLQCNITKELDIEHIKFINIIKPDTSLFLSIHREHGTLTFNYFSADITYSHGKIRI